ncbi:MAG: M42 family peptidase [Firmicutes bacterium]|nr:M42 family peptidase [[Eubacterium] siraeum]MCM1486966.1 M42 family peptidase [Bacillota bacterium]
MSLKENVKELSALLGTSGDEKEVREEIISRLPKNVKYTVDNLGSLIVEKKGKKRPKKKIMLDAHMDEVGFIITHIDDDGSLCFAPVGGIIPAVVFGRQLVFKNGTMGAVAAKPLHLLDGDEEDSQPKLDSLRIDIGAKDREEAETLVQVGDCAYFSSEQTDFGSGFMAGKALDDRVGCAIMLELINKELPYDCTFVFSVQEEIGTRGATAAVYTVNPDLAIVIEATTACDISGVSGEKQVCRLGEGPVISFMDRGTVYDRELFALGFETAEEIGIKCQTKSVVAGGNDSGAIHKSVGGVRTTTVSVPCRYLHSPSCVIKESDLTDTLKLVEALIDRLGKL